MSTFEQDAVALAWGAWTELGVAGWTRTHQDWAIDPEPLILLTAFLGDADGRLQDEATDWCVRNWRSISKVRLKNLARRAPDDARVAFGEWSATVNIHAGSSWPLATRSRRFQVTGRSSQPDLGRPSAMSLRMRALLGVGARTEILRYMLSRQPTIFTAATLAEATGYAKRMISDECDALVRAGLLSLRSIRNAHMYALKRRDDLESFVGGLPPLRPDWTAMSAVAIRLVQAEREVGSSSPRTIPVKARVALDELIPPLERLDVEVVRAVPVEELWPAVQALGTETLGEWARARWTDGSSTTDPRDDESPGQEAALGVDSRTGRR